MDHWHNPYAVANLANLPLLAQVAMAAGNAPTPDPPGQAFMDGFKSLIEESVKTGHVSDLKSVEYTTDILPDTYGFEYPAGTLVRHLYREVALAPWSEDSKRWILNEISSGAIGLLLEMLAYSARQLKLDCCAYDE
jgi:hypothetical protein